MASNPMTTGFDARELYPLLTTNTFKGTEENEIYKDCIDLEDGNRSPIPNGVEVAQQYGLGPIQQRGETTAFAIDAGGPAGYNKGTFNNYALGVDLTEDLMFYSKYGILNKITTDLGRMYSLRRNLEVAQLYDNFNNTTYYTGPDQLALGSASHTTYGSPGVSRSNILATAQLSYTSVQQLLTQMMRQLSERGYADPVTWNNFQVIIPPEYMFAASAMFNTQTKYDPESDKNAINVLHDGFTWKTTVNPFLTSQVNWFLAKPNEKHIAIWDKQQMIPDSFELREIKGVRHDIRAKWLILAEDWMYVYQGQG